MLAHFCASIISFKATDVMKRTQLLRDLTRDAKAQGFELIVDMARGKGGHCVVRCGAAFTVIKSGEITPLMERIIRKQLGL